MLANKYFSLRKLKDDVFRENHVYLTTFSAFSTIGSADAHFLRADSEISCIFTSDNVSLNKFDEVFFQIFLFEYWKQWIVRNRTSQFVPTLEPDTACNMSTRVFDHGEFNFRT